MTDLRIAVTAMLDTPGVHPGNPSWHTAFNTFFELVKEATVEEAIYGSLDHLNVHDDATRLHARANFWSAFNETRQPARNRAKNVTRSVGQAVQNVASKIKEAATADSKPESKSE